MNAPRTRYDWKDLAFAAFLVFVAIIAMGAGYQAREPGRLQCVDAAGHQTAGDFFHDATKQCVRD
jgi:hypothetical protein